MRHPSKRFLCILATIIFLAAIPAIAQQSGQAAQANPTLDFPTVLYGAAYYHEYMPYDRLDKDVALMKDAGLNVVRMC